MGERTIQDVMNEIEDLIKEAGSKGFMVSEVHSEFSDVSSMGKKKYLPMNIKFITVKG